QGRQIERDREAGLTLREQVMVSGIGLLWCRKAGELAHRPEPPAIHVAVNAARVGEFAGRRQLQGRRRLVERLDFNTTDGGESASRKADFIHLFIILQYLLNLRRSSAGESACPT